MTTRKEHGVILRNNRAAVGLTKSGKPVTAKEHRQRDALWRQHLRSRGEQLSAYQRKP